MRVWLVFIQLTIEASGMLSREIGNLMKNWGTTSSSRKTLLYEVS